MINWVKQNGQYFIDTKFWFYFDDRPDHYELADIINLLVNGLVQIENETDNKIATETLNKAFRL